MPNRIILLVEDNSNDEKQTIRALKESNIPHEIVAVQDGAEALDYLFISGNHAGRDPHAMPEFILLDLSLPNVDGLEVLQQIRAHNTTELIPVIIFTSSKEETDLMNSYKAGANSYVLKPIDADEFIAVVQQTGLYWVKLNEVPPG
jgi:two-component system response regulator